jgi:hypothetical protein
LALLGSIQPQLRNQSLVGLQLIALHVDLCCHGTSSREIGVAQASLFILRLHQSVGSDGRGRFMPDVRTSQRRYSITSLARASSVGGMARPRILAVLRLIASWNSLGRSIGSSAGRAPFRIRCRTDDLRETSSRAGAQYQVPMVIASRTAKLAAE